MKKAFYMESIAKKERIFLDIVIYCFLEFGNGDSHVVRFPNNNQCKYSIVDRIIEKKQQQKTTIV